MLSLSHLPQSQLTPEDFTDFSMDLEELYVKHSDVAVIRNHAFRHVRGIKTLDLSENKITYIENEAFTEVRFSCKPYTDDKRMNTYYALKASH